MANERRSSRTAAGKYFRWEWVEDGVPEGLASLEFVELVSTMKRDGYGDTFAEAAAYCSALKTRWPTTDRVPRPERLSGVSQRPFI
jgi:hypothetical protein